MLAYSDPSPGRTASEIFRKSRCVLQEDKISLLFRDLFWNLGFEPGPDDDPDGLNVKVWYRDGQRAVICLVDDILFCGARRSRPPAQWFADRDIVITDNHLLVQPDFVYQRLPVSFLGLYSYVPEDQDWRPQRDFTFAANRMDIHRSALLARLVKGAGGFDALMDRAWVNFNCWTYDADQSLARKQQTFRELLTKQTDLDPGLVRDLSLMIPTRNHDMNMEQSHVTSWLNVIVETYLGDFNVAFSEKIFRALCTPVPWIMLGPKLGIQYLRSLGFDVMDDVVNHREYDELGAVTRGVKMPALIDATVARLQAQDFAGLQHRCVQAADHNQQVLRMLKNRWPQEFADWLPGVVRSLYPAG